MGCPGIVRIIVASVAKEWRIRRRYPPQLWGWLVWPLLFAFGLVSTARGLAGPSGNVAGFARATGVSDYVGFLGIGTATWMALNWLLWSFGLSLRREQEQGTLEVLWMTPVPPVVLMLGRGVADLFFAFGLTLTVSLLEFHYIFGMRWIGSPVTLAVVVAASLPALYGLGLAFASIVLWVKEARGAVFFVRSVFTIFCGMTYALAVLPPWMRTVAAVMPPTYLVEAVRRVGLQGASLADLRPVLLPLLGLGGVLLIVGVVAFAWTERRVRRMGTLGAF
jgi:ABC-2 type transport system permease protein